jgi:hypothetical protein
MGHTLKRQSVTGRDGQGSSRAQGLLLLEESQPAVCSPSPSLPPAYQGCRGSHWKTLKEFEGSRIKLNRWKVPEAGLRAVSIKKVFSSLQGVCQRLLAPGASPSALCILTFAGVS